jgi:hypothetical protein
VVTAAAGASHSANLMLEDFFAGEDTVLVLQLDGVAEVGPGTLEAWQVVDLGGGRFRLSGANGALLWVRDPVDRSRAQLYVPVGSLEVEIDRSRIPDRPGPATGELVGRVGFEAAGLIVGVDEEGTRILGQVADETTRVFAEFDVAQRVEPLGDVRLAVKEGPLPLDETTFGSPQAGLWHGGLIVNAGGHTPDGRVYSTQLWYGSPQSGERDLDPVTIDDLMSGDALEAGRTFAWTESGSLDALQAGGTFSNLALADGGTLHVARYEAPGVDTWGLLEATMQAEQPLLVGGEPGATQTVSLEILAPVAPTSEPVYPTRPALAANGGDLEVGPGIVRVGNGALTLPGRVVETSVDPVEGVPIQLLSSDGSATVETNAGGEFRFTGLQPGRYEVHVMVPDGHDLARGQRDVLPLDVSADLQNWIPIFLSDAAGNGAVAVQAGSPGTDASVDGVVVRVRQAGSDAVLRTMTTGEALVGSGLSRTKVPPGRYELEIILPAGYRFMEGHGSPVTVEVSKGREAFVWVGVTHQ